MTFPLSPFGFPARRDRIVSGLDGIPHCGVYITLSPTTNSFPPVIRVSKTLLRALSDIVLTVRLPRFPLYARRSRLSV